MKIDFFLALVVAGELVSLFFLALCIQRRAVTKYPYLFCYIGFLILADIVRSIVKQYYGYRSVEYRITYCFSDVEVVLFRCVAILGFLESVLSHTRWRISAWAGVLLRIGFIATTSIFFLVRYVPTLYKFAVFLEVQRNVYFLAVLLTTLLWIAILRARVDNPQLKVIVSAFGLSAALQGVNWILEHLVSAKAHPSIAEVIYRVGPFAHLIMLSLWCYALAFLPETKRTPVTSPAQERTDPSLILAEN